jgi:hypothetical protein
MGNKATKGEVGLEVEIEANKCPVPEGCKGSYKPVPMPGMKFWDYVHDGSLRGEDNAEYILRKPILFSEVSEAIAELWAKFADYGTVVAESNRTSIHVHLNVQDFHLNRLASFMALWFALEDPLTEWCGEYRVGNLFCLRGRDAPAIVSQLQRFLKYDGNSPLPESLHYAGLNPNALQKFGSLEIRTLKGCTEPQPIIDWVSMLERLYHLSSEFPDPRDIMGRFSSEGPLGFFDTVMGDKGPMLRQGIDYTDDQICDAMYVGVRLAQSLCYCRDWDSYRPLTVKPDPFSRSLKTVASKLKKAVSSGAAPIPPAIIYSGEPTYEPEPEYDDEEQQPYDELPTLSPFSLQAAAQVFQHYNDADQDAINTLNSINFNDIS